jgi:hypothetical protein
LLASAFNEWLGSTPDRFPSLQLLKKVKLWFEVPSALWRLKWREFAGFDIPEWNWTSELIASASYLPGGLELMIFTSFFEISAICA